MKTSILSVSFKEYSVYTGTQVVNQVKRQRYVVALGDDVDINVKDPITGRNLLDKGPIVTFRPADLLNQLTALLPELAIIIDDRKERGKAFGAAQLHMLLSNAAVDFRSELHQEGDPRIDQVTGEETTYTFDCYSYHIDSIELTEKSKTLLSKLVDDIWN